MPNGYVPDEYSVETGKPYLAVVDTVLYGRLKHGAGKGLWVSPGEMRSGLVRKASPDEILLVHS